MAMNLSEAPPKHSSVLTGRDRQHGGSLASDIAETLRASPRGGIYQDDAMMTWQEVAELAGLIDDVLSADGLGDGAAIAIRGRNAIATVASFAGIVASNRCAQVLNGTQTEAAAIEASGTDALTAVIVEEAALEGDDLPQHLGVYVLLENGRIVRHRKAERAVPAQPGTAVALFTSGTTGKPKLIPMDGAILSRALDEIAMLHVGFGDATGPGDKLPPLIQYSPLAHSAGMLTTARAAKTGRSVVLMSKFNAEAWSDIVAHHRPRTTGLPPAMMRMVLEHGPARNQLASLVSVWSGSAPVNPAVADQFTQRYGLPVLGNYGATEFYGAVVSWSLDEYSRYYPAKRGAVGRARPEIAQVRIRPDGGPIGPLQIRILRLGEQWIETTDLAHIDDDGFVFLHGRVDDVINRGGFKIAPQSVMQAIRSHPLVRDAFVMGIEDARLGEVPGAIVEWTGSDPTIACDCLREFLRGRMPAYHLPSVIVPIDRIPRNLAMKVDRPAVKAILAAKLSG